MRYTGEDMMTSERTESSEDCASGGRGLRVGSHERKVDATDLE